MFEPLEGRRLLAAFAEVGQTLRIDLNTASETVGIVASGPTYALTLSGSGVWSGANSGNVSGNGASTLTVMAAAFTTVEITDSAAGCAVTFNASGGNAYAADFIVALDQPAAGSVTVAGLSSFGGNSLSVTADSINIQANVTANGGMTLQPASSGRTIGLNDPLGDFNLSAAELSRLTANAGVVIGAAGGTGTIYVGGSGAIDLSSKSFGLTLRGGDAIFSGQLRIASSATLRLSTGSITSAPGDGVDVRGGTLWLDTHGAVGSSGEPLTTALNNVRGTVDGDLFIRESDGGQNRVAISNALSVGANTIHLAGGVLSLGAANLIDDRSWLEISNGGNFELGFASALDDTVAGVTLTDGQISGGGTLTSATTFQVHNGTVAAALGGTVGLNKTTAGVVQLSRANSYTGPTVISEGVLGINQDNRLGATPNLLVIDGGVLRANQSFVLSASRTVQIGSQSGPGTGTIDVVGAFELTFNGQISERGAWPARLVKTGTGLLTLGGTNTFRGGVQIEAGELGIMADSGLGIAPATPTSGHIELRGTLRARGTFELASNRGIALGDPNGSGSGGIAVDENRTLTYNGVIRDNGTGADSLIKRRAGTLVLGNENTYTGGTWFDDNTNQLNAGVIEIRHPRALGSSGDIRYLDDATLKYGAGITEDLSHRIVTGPATVRSMVDTNGNDVEFATPLRGYGRFEKLGSGKLSFTTSGTNELAVLFVLGGTLDVSTGTLRLIDEAIAGPSNSSYGPASLFVQRAVLNITGDAVVTTTGSAVIGYLPDLPALPTAQLVMTGGELNVGVDLKIAGNAGAIVNLSGAATHVIVERDFIAGYNAGSPTVDINTLVRVKRDFIAGIDGGTPRVNFTGANAQVKIDRDFIVGKDGGSPIVSVTGGTVDVLDGRLQHLEKGAAVVNLSGGVLTVAEIVHQTASDAADAQDDSLTINLDAGGTLITDRIFLHRTGPGTQSWQHALELRFDGGLLKPKSNGAILLDDIQLDPGAGGNLIWRGVIEAGGAIVDTRGLDARVQRPLIHDPTLGALRDGGLRKQGGGALTLTADSTFTGSVIIAEDTLALDNSTSNNIISKANVIDVQFGTSFDVTRLGSPPLSGTMILANSQTLKGTGTVTGMLIGGVGSTVAPGGAHVPSGSSPGILIQNGDYTMRAGSSLDIAIGGNTPGNAITNHGQMNVTGEVRLENATLHVSSFNGYVPQLTDQYVIIRNDDNDPVIGTFAGLPEGASLPNFLNSGLDAVISYRGGDGNDVVIFFRLAPEIRLEKSTNGIDADDAPGPLIPVNSLVTWTYTVTNPGNTPLTDVTLSDDQGVVPTGPTGDANNNGALDPGETWVYTATGVATAGQYANVGQVSARDALNQSVTDTDPSHYFGYTPTGIRLEKSTNGIDADDAPGPLIPVNSLVTWTYTVTNPGNTPLTDVTLSDDQGIVPTGPTGDANNNGALDPGETWVYTATGVATAGQYANVGRVSARDALNQSVTDTDPSHYFGSTAQSFVVLSPDKNPGTPQVIKVIDSATGQVLSQFEAFEQNYTGGARIAVADLNGDGQYEIIAAPGRNHTAQVRIFTSSGEPLAGFPDFLAYDPSFNGGVSLAVADFNGDGKPDIVTVPGYGATAVRVFLNRYPQSPAFRSTPDLAFQAFSTVTIGGGVIAAADMGSLVNQSFVNAPDGKAEIIVGTGGGSKATVTVFDVSGGVATPVQTFFPFEAAYPRFQGGVTLDTGRIEAVAAPDIIVGMGVNGGSQIEVWKWNTTDASLDLRGAIPNAFTGASNNAPVHSALIDSNGDGVGDAILAVQGLAGTTGEIHRFDILSAEPFAYQQGPTLGGFPGPWFISAYPTAYDPAPLPAPSWVNSANPGDVNNDGLITPLDVLETINYINTHPGRTELPTRQFIPPRFLDSNVDNAITPNDVLVIINMLNRSATRGGEGESSEPGPAAALEIVAVRAWNDAHDGEAAASIWPLHSDVTADVGSRIRGAASLESELDVWATSVDAVILAVSERGRSTAESTSESVGVNPRLVRDGFADLIPEAICEGLLAELL